MYNEELPSPIRHSFHLGNNGDSAVLYASRRKFLASAGKDTLHPPKEFQTKRQARREYLQHIDNGLESVEEHSPAAYPYIESNLTKNPRKRRDTSIILQSIFAPTPRRSMSTNAVNPLSEKGLKLRKAAQFVMQKVIIEDFSNVNPEDWKEEFRAGVHLWINKTTGEVVTECPWLPKKSTASASTSMFSSFLKTGMGTTGAGGGNNNINQSKHSFLVTPPTTTSRGMRRLDSLNYTNYNNNNNSSSTIPVEEGTGALVYEGTELDELFALLDSAK